MLKCIGWSCVAGLLLAAGGCSGDKGDTGATGAAGDTGPAGAGGATGSAGAAGATGPAGPAGGAGPTGEGGAPGTSPEAGAGTSTPDPAAAFATATKIKHVVVVFGENISFDHYFATYPTAANLAKEPTWVAAAGTPAVNNLTTPLDPTNNFAPVTGGPNLLTANATAMAAGNLDVGGLDAQFNPFRLAPKQAFTSDQSHDYMPEQLAADGTKMDLYPEYTGTPYTAPAAFGDPAAVATPAVTMAFFDGNTLGTIWDLAQNYAMNDNSWTTNFGPSTPGAINLISGQTNGISMTNPAAATLISNGEIVDDTHGNYSLISDVDPLNDVCSSASTDQATFSGKNVGDLLNAKGITWGFFEGGFDLTVTNPNGTTGCGRTSEALIPGPTGTKVDYIQHHEPFQYYTSTANPNHLRPSSPQAIGSTYEADGKTVDPANHQYDIHDFYDALRIGNFPAVSYLKAAGYQDAHPGYSDPLDEQNFINQVMLALQSSPDWDTTAVIFAYDDSDGWYDHQAPPIVNPSSTPQDALNGAGVCNAGVQQKGAAPASPLNGAAGMPAQGRCGYGTRVPLLVVSPFSKKNYVDHTLTDQSSILKFVEDNWLGGERIAGSFDAIAGSIEGMLSF